MGRSRFSQDEKQGLLNRKHVFTYQAAVSDPQLGKSC